jgi:hypothetical protein
MFSVTIVGITLLVAVFCIEPGGASRAAAAAMPARFAAATADGHIVVMSSTDGYIERVLAVPAGTLPGRLAVTANATKVFFSFPMEPDLVGTCPRYVIDSVALDGTGRRQIASGRAPTASSDGRRLAYLRVARAGRDHRSTCVDAIVVRDLRTGRARTWSLGRRDGVIVLSWAGDSRHLLVVTDDDDGAGPLTNRLVDARRSGSLHDVDEIPVRHARVTTTVMVGGLGGRGARVAAVVNDSLIAIAGRTGRRAATLATPPPAPPGATVLPQYGDRRFVSDASGRHLLWVINRSADQTTENGVALRLSVGAREGPVLLAPCVSAAWIPDTAAAHDPHH